MTPTREETARTFAAAMGWEVMPWDRTGAIPGVRCRMEFQGPRMVGLDLPSPDAPLRIHLGFVGRVAEALGAEGFTIDSNPARVWFRVGAAIGDGKPGEDGDLSHAAMLAAIAAREPR